MSRVKDCPFCGGVAGARRYYNSYEGTRYFIECIQCGATSSHRPTEELAIDIWNSRVELMELRNADNVKPKKYYLRHKFLGILFGTCLNYKYHTGEFCLSNTGEAAICQTQFTDSEIEEIEEKGFDLTNYEKIEINIK